MSCGVLYSEQPETIEDPIAQYKALLSILERIRFTCDCFAKQTEYLHKQVRTIKQKITKQKVSSGFTIPYRRVMQKLELLNSMLLNNYVEIENTGSVMFRAKIAEAKKKCPNAHSYSGGF